MTLDKSDSARTLAEIYLGESVSIIKEKINVQEPFLVRKYVPADNDGCRALWRELTEWHRHIYQDPSIGGACPEDFFDKHLAKVGPERLWIAFQDSRVVGLTGLIVKDREAEIEPLLVSASYRHKGIGKTLVGEVVKEARRLEVRFLSVSPVARNIEAIQFFYEHGFRNLGHVELFVDFFEHRWKKGPKLFDRQFNF